MDMKEGEGEREKEGEGEGEREMKEGEGEGEGEGEELTGTSETAVPGRAEGKKSYHILPPTMLWPHPPMLIPFLV